MNCIVSVKLSMFLTKHSILLQDSFDNNPGFCAQNMENVLVAQAQVKVQFC